MANNTPTNPQISQESPIAGHPFFRTLTGDGRVDAFRPQGYRATRRAFR
jgi:hypothetical protein